MERAGLFQGITAEEMNQMLQCLQANFKVYEKGECIYRIGDYIESMGVIVKGSVLIEHDDAWGNGHIIERIGKGQVFAETYACVSSEPLMINVVAAEKTEIMFLNMARVLKTCTSTCQYHSRLIQNMLFVTSRKNLALTKKIFHTSPKSLRGKLLSYLSDQAIQARSEQFEIPFNRQQLADYLGVDRSALSNEISKMKQDGLLEVDRNQFCLRRQDKI